MEALKTVVYGVLFTVLYLFAAFGIPVLTIASAISLALWWAS